MAKQRKPFQMKQFAVSDARSANKIGVDGVLTGSWAPIISDPRRILDVGCGCGIISLMMAQRVSQADVVGIDIEPNAIEEARENVRNSPFSKRIRILLKSFEEISSDIKNGSEERFDIIISNPPFFESGVNPVQSERMLARHTGSLSPEILIDQAGDCLQPGGFLIFIGPYEHFDDYLHRSVEARLCLYKCCRVKGNPKTKSKRILLAFRKASSEIIKHKEEYFEGKAPMETLVIETSPGNYTPEYQELGRQFYLKF